MKPAQLAPKSLIAFSLALFGAGAHAQSLEEAARAALDTNPALDGVRALEKSESEAKVQARANYLPRADFTLDAGDAWSNRWTGGGVFFGTIVQKSDHSFNTMSVDLVQQVYAGGFRSASVAQAQARLGAANATVASAEQDVLLRTVASYAEIVRTESNARSRRLYAEGFETRVSAVETQVKAGVLTRTDLAQTLTRREVARAGVVASAAALDNARTDFTEVTGLDGAGLAPLGPAPQTPETLVQALEIARLNHPELRRAEKLEDAAREQARIERAALLPQIGLAARYAEAENVGARDIDEDSASVRLTLTVPLYERGVSASRMRQAGYGLAQARAETAAIRRGIERDVTTAWRDLDSARATLDIAQRRVSHARGALEGVERERQYGLRSVLDVLNAQDELLAAELNLHDAEVTSVVAAYALLARTGALSIESFTGGEDK